jgi:F0F1-type ATP synthase membrane subunit c/vacuolar-type H+-ATPase subunit K
MQIAQIPGMNEPLTDLLVGAAFVEAAVMAGLLFELIYELPH